MNTVHERVEKLLIDAEHTLKLSHLWETKRPSLKALSSTQPFAVDSLHPEQWLQWIFIPKMQQLVNSSGNLPTGFAITPYFEQCRMGDPKWVEIIEVLRQIEEACA